MSKENKIILVSYNKDFQRLGTIDIFRSLLWTRKYYEAGTFELHAPLNERNLDLLKEENLISKREYKKENGKIVKAVSKDTGIVEDITIDDVTNEITAKGRFLTSILDRRVIKNIVTFQGSIEEAMRKLVSEMTPFPSFMLGSLQGNQSKVQFQVSYKNLYTYLCRLSKYGNIGFYVRADFKGKKMYFETYEGVDRTRNQRQRSQVIFSEVYRNLVGVSYVYNNQNMKNCAIVAGAGEGKDRILVSLNESNAKGWELRETVVDAREIKKEEGMTMEAYKELLKQKGREKLGESGIVEAIDCQTNPFSNFVYKVDYDLGDIVTVEKKNWKITKDKRITEIQEVYENGAFTIVPTFGEPLPEKVDLEN